MNRRLKTLLCISFLIMSLSLPVIGFGQDIAEEQIQEADRLFQANRFSQARVLYQKYVSLNPGGRSLPKARFRLGECFMDDSSQQLTQRMNKAITEFQRVVSLFPEDSLAPQALYKMAICYINTGFVQDGIIQLRTARESYPEAENSEKILLLMAESYMHLEDANLAGVYYTTLLQAYPGSTYRKDALKGLIRSYHKLASYSNLEQAVILYRQIAPAEFREDFDLRFLWCESLLFTGKLQRAEEELQLLLASPEGQYIAPHIRMRMGEVAKRKAEKQTDQETAIAELGKAIEQFKLVLGMGATRQMTESALMKIIEISDQIETDFSSYGLGDAQAVLDQIYFTNEDPDYRALILTKMARHHRARGRTYTSLQYYKRISEEFQEASLHNLIVSEFHQYTRQLMAEALSAGDRSTFVDYYLGFGEGMELDKKERLELGQSYVFVELYDKAEGVFSDLLIEGVDEEGKRTIAIAKMTMHFKRKNFASARKEMENVLSMSPTFEQKEQALLMKQEMLFADKKLGDMQKYFLEQTPEFDTPSLRYSILHKLGILYFLDGQSEESISYLQRFLAEFGDGMRDDLTLLDNIKTATISLADLYYQKGDYQKAKDYYQRYIFRFERKGNIAWPLKQLALCYSYQGKYKLAAEMFDEFLRAYPKHYLKAQAEKDLEEIKKKLPDENE